MTMSDTQIERYSRQIIIPKFGARAQGRLLASRLKVVAHLQDSQTAIAYLAGAGVGHLEVNLIYGSEHDRQTLARNIAGLNPDVRLAFEMAGSGRPDLYAALISSRDSLAAARSSNYTAGPTIAARLDSHGRILIIPRRPPCLECADEEFLAPVADRSRNAGFIAMVFTTEVIKMLIEPSAYATAPSIIEFNGYASYPRSITGERSCRVCSRGEN